MREFISLFVFYLSMQIPWTNGFFIGISWTVSMAALLFLCLCIVERYYIGDKMGFRIGDIDKDTPPPEGEQDMPPEDGLPDADADPNKPKEPPHTPTYKMFEDSAD